MQVRLAGRPTVDLLVVFAVVFLLQQVLALVSASLMAALFFLDAPVAREPWALVTSVYAHGSVSHLVSNTVGMVLFGLLVERVTTRWWFHLFFLTVGALSGATEIAWQQLLGADQPGVVGASGGVLGLLGYVVAGNAIADRTVGRLELDVREQVLVFGAIAVAITVVTMGPQVAVVGHFVGLVCGLVAGRLRLLHVRRPREPAPMH